MKSRELFLARRYKEFNLEFPGIPKAARSSISSGSAGAVAPHADVGGVNANVRVATDIGGPSYELTKAFADVAFAEARHLDDQLDSDRVSLSHPSLRRTISVSAKSHTPTQLQSQISRPAASPSPAPSPSPSAAPEAESAVQGTGYPYYDFRRRGRVPTVRGSDSSDAYSSDEEHEIVRSPCSPTNVYIHGAACTNCGHINYSQTTFTSSVSASVPSSKASVNTTSSRLPVATTPTIRDMSSALRFGPVLPRHTKSPASPPVSPPLSSQKSTKTKSPMEGTHVSSTATIHLEQYRRVSVDSASR
ncbi:hypothetical protein H4R19_007079 [Coemansia spiralis]|nr:hypothetical protein H4R19_007079 [Coemansia spiralis]